jgi:nucleoid-associated protein YgaU
MGYVQQAVLDFDQEVQAPWRPRLVAVPDPVEAVRPLRPHPSRRSPSRVGVCAPPAPSARPVAPARRVVPREQVARDGSPRPRVRATGPAGRRASARRSASVAGPVRLRPTRRAKRLAVVLALAAGVALGSWLGPLLGGGGSELRLAGESSVIVQSGDTLWSIATALQSDGDVRALVDEIQRLNGLEGAELVPGQVLQLP